MSQRLPRGWQVRRTVDNRHSRYQPYRVENSGRQAVPSSEPPRGKRRNQMRGQTMQRQNNSIRSMEFSSGRDSCTWELADAHTSQTAIPLLEPVSQPTARKPCVLVLEDDNLQAQLLKKTIDSLGLSTLFAPSIAEARRQLKRQPIQLGVFDLHLPDGSGIDLCREIDNDPLLAGLPVVIVSSAKQDHIIRQSRAVGCSYFISKPYDPNVLVAIIERLIDLSA